MNKKTIFKILILSSACVILTTCHSNKSFGTITIEQIFPEPGSIVDSLTVISASLSYSIINFKEGSNIYHVTLQFKLSSGGSFSKGEEAKVDLNQSRSKISFSFPLAKVWDSPELVKPINIYFVLTETSGSRRRINERTEIVPRKTIARSKSIIYEIANR